MGFHSTRLLRFVASTSALGLVIASAGFGAVFAHKIGNEHGAILAVLSVMMALALEGVKPLAVAYAIRSFKELKIAQALALLVLGIVAVAYSLTSELSLMASSRSDLQARREAEGLSAKNARDGLQRLSTELVALSFSRTAGELDALIDGKLSSRKNLNGCVGWLPSPADRQVCVEVSELQAERARSEKRSSLERERNRLEQVVSGGSAMLQSDPGSKSLAVYLGALGFSMSPEMVATWLNLVPVLALEIGSAFAVVLVAAVQGGSAMVPESQLGSRITREVAQGAPMQLIAAPVSLRDQVSREIVRQLVNHGGSLRGSERAIADLVGADRSTVRRAAQDLAHGGIVSLTASKRGTTIGLIS